MIRLPLLVFILVPCLGLCQTYVLEGTVFGNSIGLSYSNIFINHLSKGTTTDANGYFQLEGLPMGRWVIDVSYVGYESQSIEVEIPRDNPIEIELIPATTLEEVVVTGSMKAVEVSKSAIKVDVLNAKKLETFLPAASSSLIENM